MPLGHHVTRPPGTLRERSAAVLGVDLASPQRRDHWRIGLLPRAFLTPAIHQSIDKKIYLALNPAIANHTAAIPI